MKKIKVTGSYIGSEQRGVIIGGKPFTKKLVQTVEIDEDMYNVLCKGVENKWFNMVSAVEDADGCFCSTSDQVELTVPTAPTEPTEPEARMFSAARMSADEPVADEPITDEQAEVKTTKTARKKQAKSE